MTQEVRLMVGIPASGKSTWIEQEVARLEDDHKTVAVISRDYVRKSILGISDEEVVSSKFYFSKEKAVFNEFVRQANEVMALGIDIVFIDATHINPISRNKILSRLRPDPNTSLVLEVFYIDPEVAIKRNKNRTGFAKVSDAAIWDMYNNFKMPTRKEFVDNLYGFKQVIIKGHGR